MKTKTSSLVALPCLLMASCTEPPDAAPPDSVTVHASAEGLRKLFSEECIDQKHKTWALDQAARSMDYNCLPQEGTCRQNHDGRYSWAVSLSDGQAATVSMLWLPDSSQFDISAPLTCSIEVDMNMAPALREAAKQIVESGETWGQVNHMTDPQGEDIWFWNPREETDSLPQLVLGPTSDGSGRSQLMYGAFGRFPGS